MGRHADAAESSRRLRISIPIVAICVLLIGAAALGVWWWRLKSVTDPIDADPVDAYAVVVSAPACTDTAGGNATVTISGTAPAVTASLNACGYAPGARIAVQYLAGHPDQVRLSGTSIAGKGGMASRLLPLGILAAGMVAVLATIALLVDRRRSRHVEKSHRVTVAQLQAARATPAAGWRVSEFDGASGGPAGGGERSAPAPFAEPTHVLPSGFVMIDEHLFTHDGLDHSGASHDGFDPDGAPHDGAPGDGVPHDGADADRPGDH